MTATLNGTARHAALAAARQAADAGMPLTGAELAERFDRSERWGRQIAAEARAAGDPVPEAAAATGRQEGGNLQDTDGLGPVEVATQVATVEAPAGPSGSQLPDGTGAADEPLPRHAGRRGWLDTSIILAVAVVAAAASYGHMRHVAELAGEPGWIAALFPVTVDGLVLAAIRRGKAGRWWLAAGLLASIGANVLGQFPEAAVQAGPVVSAWPPVALFGTHRLLSRG